MIALLLLAAVSTPVTYTILGEGTLTCGVWTDRRQAEPNRILPEMAWVSGYVTAMARVDTALTHRQIASGLAGSPIDHWIDNYCTAHPLDKVETAASALVEELKARAR